MKKLKMPELKFNLKDPHIRRLTKKVMFIDIETSLVDAKVFRTGNQYIQASQLTSQTRILTVAGGSLHDLVTKGKEGVWSCSNHRSSTFKKNPLDDTEILATVWDILDKAEGALQQVMKQLKEKFGCTTLEAAKKKLKLLKKQGQEAEVEFDKAVEEFEEEWNDKL